MKVPEIYNAYLGASRRAQNAPWRARKDFTGFEDTPDGFICKRLEMFFKKFPQINVYEFFQAPFELYKDSPYVPLKFFTTQKAIATYSIYQKQRQEESPDSDEQVKDIKKTIRYIAVYCTSKGISLEEYCNEKSGYTNKPFVDYANKLVNIYVLIKLPFFDTQVKSLSLQDRELYLKNAYNSISKFKMRLNVSTRAKFLIEEGLRLISNTTNKN